MMSLREEAPPYEAPAAGASAPRPDGRPRRAPPAPRPAARAAADERLTEAQLSALWRGRRFPAAALVTRAGVPVTVLHQGRPGRGPGPDFRGAVVRGPSGLTARGDVELHVRASSFRAHGHEGDPAYANVILHVVFDDDCATETPLFGGRTAPVVALAPWVAQRAGELRRWLERPPLWREPCHDAVALLGPAATAAALDGEGDRRFAARSERHRRRADEAGSEQAVYEGLLEALGYGGNAGAMLELARRLPWRRLEESAEAPPHGGPGADECDRLAATPPPAAAPSGVGAARTGRASSTAKPPPAATTTSGERRRLLFEALLLGSAGLLPSARQRASGDRHVVALERASTLAGLTPMPVASWKLWGVRPANAPARRIAAAAALLACAGRPSALLACAGAATTREALAPLLTEATGYWRTHHDPCADACLLPPALIGRGRALELLVNVILPAAAIDPSLGAPARALYAILPRPASYGATRFLEDALASSAERLPLGARRAQGLLALHRDWCTQGGCGRCPLSP
ncbi:MAG: DUF2851 family protein [Dehalococcoidia bacterium]|nr:DUF2851 family protein [Dehalococcoidia bacterium]